MNQHHPYVSEVHEGHGPAAHHHAREEPLESPVSPVRRHYRHRFGTGTASVVFRTVTVLDSLTEPGAPH